VLYHIVIEQTGWRDHRSKREKGSRGGERRDKKKVLDGESCLCRNRAEVRREGERKMGERASEVSEQIETFSPLDSETAL